MASDHSFDIVSEVDLNEMHNAVMQAQKEISQRFDFRGTSAGVGELDKKEKLVTITADNEPHLEAVVQVLVSKMIKRGIDAKALQKQIQDLKLKVRAQIQGDALRVVGAKLDELQAVQAAIRAKPPEIPVQFNNYK
jgi:uncharacterized protein YajQ (UPF0234 family)